MPGFEKSRVVGVLTVELAEFACSICFEILVNPVVSQCCRQTYCKECITEWLTHDSSCPNDRQPLSSDGLASVSQIVTNLLSNMRVKCDFESNGCKSVVRMHELADHSKGCDYNRNKKCKNCGLSKYGSTDEHNCIENLIIKNERISDEIERLRKENEKLKTEKTELMKQIPNHERTITSTSITPVIKLQTTENVWKPNRLAINATERQTLALLKRFRGILNKLMPQNYDDLVKQILNFNIDTEDRLKRVLDLVYESAVNKPAYCFLYANLCKRLSNFKVMVKKDDNIREVKFHKLLLSKCQKEFEADIYASITDLKERKAKIESVSDPQKCRMLSELLDEDMRRALIRSLGNIKLIGELYKLNMLRGNIMVQCIENLLNKDADDESLECLCALFETIGDQIESEAEAANSAKQNYTLILDNFFAKMENISEQKHSEVKGTSARIRFMLRDVIEMRKNNWKVRENKTLFK